MAALGAAVPVISAIGGLIGAGTGLASLVRGTPKAPGLPPVPTMPDQKMIEQAQQKSLADQLARRGRASTILTGAPDNPTGKLGG